MKKPIRYVGTVRGTYGKPTPAMLTAHYRRYVTALSPNGTIRTSRADDVRPGEQPILTFRAYEGPQAIRRARFAGDWVYRHYDC